MTSTTSTLEGLSEETLEGLRMQLRGPALTPGDPGYEAVRPVFNAMHTDRPGLIVECSGTADVVDAVNFAREHGLDVTVRGGGHSVAGLSSSDGGFVIDLAPMNGVIVDPEKALAHVQGGALWADVDREAQLYGLATPGGLISDTGVGGLTLGGGVGWLRRKHGLSCDNLVEAELVLASGEVVTASADENTDLFWALKGGGGNFGVVTRFTFQLHPLGPIVAFAGVFYPGEETGAVIRGLREYLATAPDEVTPMTLTITLPADPNLPPPVHDQPVQVVAAVYAGDPEKGMEAVQPLRELATPLADISQPMPYRIVQAAFDPLVGRQTLHSYWKSVFVPELSEELVDLIAAKAKERPTPLSMVAVWPIDAAVMRVGEDESSFADRSARYMISIEGNSEDPADVETTIEWVRGCWGAFSEFGTGSTYLNFTGLSDETSATGVDAAFGSKLERLAKIKGVYDPDNFFHNNNNIQPAA